MSEPESYEEWRARTSTGTAPTGGLRNRRLMAGLFGVLGVLCLFVDEPGARLLASGLFVLTAENLVHVYAIRRDPKAEASTQSVAARGLALAATLALAVWGIFVVGVLATLVVVVLLVLDVADDPSFLRWAQTRLRGRG